MNKSLVEEQKKMWAHLAKLEKEFAAAQRELERFRHGETIESDFICPNQFDADELKNENARLKATLKNVDNCNGYHTRCMACLEDYEEGQNTHKVDVCRANLQRRLKIIDDIEVGEAGTAHAAGSLPGDMLPRGVPARHEQGLTSTPASPQSQGCDCAFCKLQVGEAGNVESEGPKAHSQGGDALTPASPPPDYVDSTRPHTHLTTFGEAAKAVPCATCGGKRKVWLCHCGWAAQAMESAERCGNCRLRSGRVVCPECAKPKDFDPMAPIESLPPEIQRDIAIERGWAKPRCSDCGEEKHLAPAHVSPHDGKSYPDEWVHDCTKPEKLAFPGNVTREALLERLPKAAPCRTCLGTRQVRNAVFSRDLRDCPDCTKPNEFARCKECGCGVGTMESGCGSCRNFPAQPWQVKPASEPKAPERCCCGEVTMPSAGVTAVESGCVKHRVALPCYHIIPTTARVAALEAVAKAVRPPDTRHLGDGVWHMTCVVCGAQWTSSGGDDDHPDGQCPLLRLAAIDELEKSR